MIIVADTTPINYFVLIGAIAILQELFGHVIIPQAVFMDDRDGTKEARRHHLTVLGTLVLLDKAAERKLLDLPEAIAQLAQTTFRFPPAEVVEEMIERDIKRKQARQE